MIHGRSNCTDCLTTSYLLIAVLVIVSVACVHIMKFVDSTRCMHHLQRCATNWLFSYLYVQCHDKILILRPTLRRNSYQVVLSDASQFGPIYFCRKFEGQLGVDGTICFFHCCIVATPDQIRKDCLPEWLCHTVRIESRIDSHRIVKMQSIPSECPWIALIQHCLRGRWSICHTLPETHTTLYDTARNTHNILKPNRLLTTHPGPSLRILPRRAKFPVNLKRECICSVSWESLVVSCIDQYADWEGFKETRLSWKIRKVPITGNCGNACCAKPVKEAGWLSLLRGQSKWLVRWSRLVLLPLFFLSSTTSFPELGTKTVRRPQGDF